jgi:hypothetical protein
MLKVNFPVSSFLLTKSSFPLESFKIIRDKVLIVGSSGLMVTNKFSSALMFLKIKLPAASVFVLAIKSPCLFNSHISAFAMGSLLPLPLISFPESFFLMVASGTSVINDK